MGNLVKERVRLLNKRRTHAQHPIEPFTLCGKTLKRKWPLKTTWSYGTYPDVDCKYCKIILKRS